MFLKKYIFCFLALELLISSSRCDYVKEIKGLPIEGIVLKKDRLEWNHNEPQLDFTNYATNRFFLGLRLQTEKSGFWDFVNVGDSISKKENSMKVNVYRSQVLIKSFQLRYGDCIDVK